MISSTTLKCWKIEVCLIINNNTINHFFSNFTFISFIIEHLQIADLAAVILRVLVNDSLDLIQKGLVQSRKVSVRLLLFQVLQQNQNVLCVVDRGEEILILIHKVWVAVLLS